MAVTRLLFFSFLLLLLLFFHLFLHLFLHLIRLVILFFVSSSLATPSPVKAILCLAILSLSLLLPLPLLSVINRRLISLIRILYDLQGRLLSAAAAVLFAAAALILFGVRVFGRVVVDEDQLLARLPFASSRGGGRRRGQGSRLCVTLCRRQGVTDDVTGRRAIAAVIVRHRLPIGSSAADALLAILGPRTASLVPLT